MGQLALGFRSLLFRLAVFFVMAALLAWALGGTLFPKPHVRDFDGVEFQGERWFWRLSITGPREGAVVSWEMMRAGQGDAEVVQPSHRWLDVADPIVAEGRLYYAGLDQRDRWLLVYNDGTGGGGTIPLPDRLAVEQQLARLRAGLSLQDSETILAQRQAVLNPAGDSVDGGNGPTD